MIHSRPFVDKLPIELTVLVGLFESICNFNDLCGVNQVDSSVSTNLTRMILGMEAIFLDLLSLSSLDKPLRSDGQGFVSDDSVEEEHYCRNYNYP